MPIRISNLRLSVDEPEAALQGRLARVLGVPADALPRWRILRKSLDARDRGDVHFVYAAEVTVPDDEARVIELARRRVRPPAQVELYHEPPFEMPPPGARPLPHRPVVIG